MVGSVFGGSAPSAPNLTTFQYPDMKKDAGSFNTLLNQNIANNPSAKYAPQATGIYQNMISDPNAAGYTGAASAAGSDLAGLSAISNTNAGATSRAGNNLYGYADTVANMGLDPQSALYNRTLQQLQQQSAVTNAQNGLAMSPYGADLTNEAIGNFDINWNAQQLNNAISGLNAAGTADSIGGNLMTTANKLGSEGAAEKLASGQIPYTASQGVGNNNATSLNSLISTLTGANNTNQMSMHDILSYLSGGSAQSNAQAQLDEQNYQNQLAQYNAKVQGLDSIGSQLGGFMFGGSSGGGGGSSTAANAGELMAMLLM